MNIPPATRNFYMAISSSNSYVLDLLDANLVLHLPLTLKTPPSDHA